MPPKPKRFLQKTAAIGACLGGLSLGNVIGWSSPAYMLLVEEYNVTEVEFSEITAIMTLGAATSQISTAIFLDLIGRKRLMIIVAVPLIISWCMLAFAVNLLMYHIGRFLSGFCAATFCVAAPAYIGELSDKDIRGTLCVMFQFFQVIGILTTFSLGEFQNMYCITLPHCVFPLTTIIVLALIPESPVFLYKIGKIEKAKNSLQRFRGKEYNIDAEFREIEEYIGNTKESFWATIKQKSNRRGFLQLLVLHLIQQLSGINAIMFYAHKIFLMVDTSLSPGICAIILGSVQVAFTGASTYQVELTGRKVLWTFSLSSMCVCCFTLGLYFLIQKFHESLTTSVAFIPITAVCLYIAGYSAGCGPLPWAMIGEMLPNRIKGVAGATAAFTNWMLAFAVAQAFPHLIDYLGGYMIFWAFAIICALGVIYVNFVLTETSGKTLEEIQEELAQ